MFESFFDGKDGLKNISFVFIFIGLFLAYLSVFVEYMFKFDNDFLLVPGFLISFIGIFWLFKAVSPNNKGDG
ncbi:hypothetical protein [Methanonatronarchaeum thermophilum]|uniref:hypothetical protein n=1 Tax=Methanonatronarchaeum thermophilum TaxID=1927129 RepID=UPI000A3C9E95|nr:hypothetical protein [Methanonatronarchaeum thermophilum]